MKKSNFAAFFNRMGHVRAKYGGVLVKKTEQNGELKLHVMQWRNMITDQVDIHLPSEFTRRIYIAVRRSEYNVGSFPVVTSRPFPKAH